LVVIESKVETDPEVNKQPREEEKDPTYPKFEYYEPERRLIKFLQQIFYSPPLGFREPITPIQSMRKKIRQS
jgi:hypothetical protein